MTVKRLSMAGAVLLLVGLALYQAIRSEASRSPGASEVTPFSPQAKQPAFNPGTMTLDSGSARSTSAAERSGDDAPALAPEAYWVEFRFFGVALDGANHELAVELSAVLTPIIPYQLHQSDIMKSSGMGPSLRFDVTPFSRLIGQGGSLKLDVQVDGYVGKVQLVDTAGFSAGEDGNVVRVYLEQGVIISGVVLDESGEPRSGASVLVVSLDEDQGAAPFCAAYLVTRGSGLFEFCVSPSGRLFLLAFDACTSISSVDLGFRAAGARVDEALRLSSGFSVEGQAFAGAEAEVILSPRVSGFSFIADGKPLLWTGDCFYRQVRRQSCSSEGFFVFGGVSPGDYAVRVEIGAGGCLTGEANTNASVRVPEAPFLSLSAPPAVLFSVSNAEGGALVGAEVVILEGERELICYTDQEGLARWHCAPSESQVFVVRKDGFVEQELRVAVSAENSFLRVSVELVRSD